MWVAISIAVTAVGYLIGIALIPQIVMQRRESGATLAWVLLIVFLPYVGAFLFLAIGTQTIRWRRKRRERAERAVAPGLATSTLPVRPFEALAEETTEPALGEPARDLAHLADRLARHSCGGNAIELLVDAQATFAGIEAVIARARSHVHLDYYIWRADDAGRRLRDLLVGVARSGVEVRVLVDDVGSRAAGKAFWRPLVEAGGHVGRFLAVNFVSRWLALNLNNRNHRKIIVVDGTIGFTGGLNIGDEHFGRIAAVGGWRDTHLRLEGPVVARLQEIFVEDWFHATGQDLTDGRYFPPPTPAGAERVQILASGPDDGRARAIETIYFAALTLARKRAWLTTPYFVPDAILAAALRTAALRGVDVRILVPGQPDQPFVYHAARSFYPELLEAGVGIYEYSPAIRLHAKTAAVDGCWATVGSANLDLRSFRLNFEANAVAYGPRLARELERVFEKDLALARRLEPAEFRDRSLLTRACEGAARVLAPLL
jgi:cardiolipin synthase